jgi:hypothetical protein
MASEETSHAAIRIKEDRDGDRPIILHPGDDDLFVRTGKQVIEACRLGISVEVWINELNAMLQKVQGWLDKQSARVRACYCAPRRTRVILFFVPATDQFDFDLADDLAALNGELTKNFNVGMVEMGQVPADEVDRFLDREHTPLVWGADGRQPESHPTVEA